MRIKSQATGTEINLDVTMAFPANIKNMDRLRSFLSERDAKNSSNAHFIEYGTNAVGKRYPKYLHIAGLTDWDWEYLFHSYGLRRFQASPPPVRTSRPSSRLNVGDAIYTKRQATAQKRKLDKLAVRNGWTAPELGARKAWVTMRTVGWAPKSASEGA